MKLKIIDNKEYFECKACEKIISYKSFGTHFRRIHHISSEEYTIKYEQYNNKCEHCGNNTKYLSLKKGFDTLCKDCRYKDTIQYKTECILNQLKDNDGYIYIKNKEDYDLYDTCSHNIEHYDRKVKFKCEVCGKINIKSFGYLTKDFICKHCSISKSSLNSMDKRIKTNQQNWGCDNVFQSKEIIKKCKETKKLLYNDENYSNNKQARETYKNNTGYECNLQDPKVIKQIKQTKKKLYNDENYNNRKKAQETCMKKWGVSHQMQVPTIAKKTRKKHITYDNLNFDSRFEVSFYKFLKEHNVDFTYQPAIGLPYIFGEEKHVYNPDFLIGNQFIELKGLQFFEDKDPNKKMVNPFHYKNDTSEIIKYRNDLMEAKHQCMIKNGVKIITSEKEFEDILCIIVI